MTRDIHASLLSLSDAWGGELDQRDDLEQLIISKPEEAAITKLVELTRAWQKQQSDLQRERARKARENGTILGRSRIELPSVDILRMRRAKGESFGKIGKSLGVSKKTVMNRLKEG